jgi:hypothetical protein
MLLFAFYENVFFIKEFYHFVKSFDLKVQLDKLFFQFNEQFC